MTTPAAPFTRTCANERCAKTFTPKLRRDGEPMASKHGWCPACAGRWQRAGRPESGVPDAQKPGDSGRAQRTAQSQAERERAAQMEAKGIDRIAIGAAVNRTQETLRKWLGPPKPPPPPVKGTPAMPRTITSDVMPHPETAAAAPATTATPELAEWNWHPVGDQQREAINRAVKQALARDNAVIAGVGG
jgi:hypothetical protein